MIFFLHNTELKQQQQLLCYDYKMEFFGGDKVGQ